MIDYSEMNGSAKNFLQPRLDSIKLILQSLAEGVCVIDADSRIVFANDACANMTGFRLEELLGESYEKIFFPKQINESSSETDVCPVKFTLLEGANAHINAETFYRKDGSDFLVEYMSAPIFEQNEIIGAVLNFEDITERREIEVAISKARDAAYESARIKSAFLANMSHEIRTPLSGIIGTTNLLAETNLTDEQHALVNMLRKSAGWLMETVNDILDYSKIEAGKLSLEAVDFDISQTVSEIAELYNVSAAEKNLHQVCEIDEKIPEILRGDVSRLRQVLGNLLANAIKFTETGTVLLKVSLVEKKLSECIVRFEVTDTGIGISEEQRANLFQPFIQADVSTNRRFGGTGLGLTICRELVELMHGKIDVESVLGKGSVFWFEIPLTISGQSVARSSRQKSNFSDAEIINGNFEIYPLLKVLVAEDNDVNRLVVLKMLEKIGIKADSARSGTEAVNLAGKKTYDLILMDCQMPETDGFTATKYIKRDLDKSPVIIALTANTSLDEREKCIRAGMNDFLSKPLMKEDLEAVLRKYFPEFAKAGSGFAKI